MRKLNRYGWLVLVAGLTILVLTLAQGCKPGGRTPEPGLDATHVTTVQGTGPARSGGRRRRCPDRVPHTDGVWNCVHCGRDLPPGAPVKCPH